MKKEPEKTYENKSFIPDGPMKKRPGMKLVETGEDDFELVDMTQFRGDIIVCTKTGVYRIEGDQVVPIVVEADFKAADERYEDEKKLEREWKP